MNSKLTIVLFFVILIAGLSTAVLADAEESPLWFRLLEPLGAIIGIVALIISYKNFKNFGGVLGKSYTYIMAMLALFILAFIWRSLIEQSLIPENIATEVVFEALLYIGVVLIAVASSVALRGFRK